MNTTTMTPNAQPAVQYLENAKTGNLYIGAFAAKKLPMCAHWDRRRPLHVYFEQTVNRTPLVTLDDCLGCGGDYTPDELRLLAATLIRIAQDADAHPMGKRTFYRAELGYPVHLPSKNA